MGLPGRSRNWNSNGTIDGINNDDHGIKRNNTNKIDRDSSIRHLRSFSRGLRRSDAGLNDVSNDASTGSHHGDDRAGVTGNVDKNHTDKTIGTMSIRKKAGVNSQTKMKRGSWELEDNERRIWDASVGGAALASSILRETMMLLRPYKSDIVDVAAIDNDWRVALGPRFFTYSQAEREAIVIHCCLHAVCNYSNRSKAAGQSDADAMRIAQDLEINQMVMTLSRVRLPAGSVIPRPADGGDGGDLTVMDVPPGRSMEQYYQLLMHGRADDSTNGTGGPSTNGDRNGDNDDASGDSAAAVSSSPDGADGSDNGSGPSATSEWFFSDDSESADGSDSQNSDGAENGDTNGDNGPSSGSSNGDTNGDSGSSNGPGSGPNSGSSNGDNGHSDVTNDDSHDDNGHTDSDDSSDSRGSAAPCGNALEDAITEDADRRGVPKSREDQKVTATARMVEEAERISSITGRMPGLGTSDKRFAIDLTRAATPPSIDWRRKLLAVSRDLMSKQAYKKTEYSFKRINRRGSAFMRDVAFPSVVGYEPKIMMGIDTSYSVSHDARQMASIVRNAEDIMKSVSHGSRGSFRAFCVDSRMKDVQLVDSVDDLDLTGGGGTDMSPAFEYVSKMSRRERPDVFILATDGELSDRTWDKCAEAWPGNVKVILLITDSYYMDRIPQWVFSEATVIDIVGG